MRRAFTRTLPLTGLDAVVLVGSGADAARCRVLSPDPGNGMVDRGACPAPAPAAEPGGSLAGHHPEWRVWGHARRSLAERRAWGHARRSEISSDQMPDAAIACANAAKAGLGL